jgi:hypothetical protein
MAKNEKGLARHEHGGVEHVPAYRTGEDVPNAEKSMGIPVRPASYTNRSVRGAGVDNKSAYQRKAKPAGL